jgi:hypothetical protein
MLELIGDGHDRDEMMATSSCVPKKRINVVLDRYLEGLTMLQRGRGKSSSGGGSLCHGCSKPRTMASST